MAKAISYYFQTIQALTRGIVCLDLNKALKTRSNREENSTVNCEMFPNVLKAKLTSIYICRIDFSKLYNII